MIGTCLGLGLLPWAPGTWGSLGGLFFWGVLLYGQVPLVYLIFLIGIFSFLGWRSVLKLDGVFAKKDASEIVIDEWVGMGVTLLFLQQMNGFGFFLAFVLFRLFDVLKPFGVRFFDRHDLKGWGVILDDVVAGLYAGLVIWGVQTWLV